MKHLKITSKELEYNVTVSINPENNYRYSRGIGKNRGTHMVRIFHPDQSNILKGHFYWSGQAIFENPKNDYESIFNYIKKYQI